jgi:putative CocE/NonD family hydrolase
MPLDLEESTALPNRERIMRRITFAILWLLLACFGMAAVHGVVAAKATPAEIADRYDKKDVMIPMRDGVRLHTLVHVPRDIPGPLPFILLRTPYGVSERSRKALNGSLAALAREGYLIVLQDIRGRYQSEGQFVMNHAPRDKKDPRAVDEGTDAYDTTEWLLKNIAGHNGRVGMLGLSYDGWLTVMAMIEPHPALKAYSPQASPADMFLGDDFHHNGAFRLSYGFEYVAMMETSKVNVHFQFDRHDTYDWYLRLGALSNIDRQYFHGKMPSWNDFVNHPNYDAFWQKQAVAPYLTQVRAPTLNVGGWFDQEDFYGSLKVHEKLDQCDRKEQNFLVLGPWNHGGWRNEAGERLGRITFGSATAKHFREEVEAPWFAYYLKDKGTPKQPRALTFQTGTNRWVSHGEWPPRDGIEHKKLYMHAGGKLAFSPPADSAQAYDSYISDPAHPVPYRPRPVRPTYPGPEWPEWLVQDQRFVHQRPDVLSWETAPLAEDVALAGNLSAHLFASTSGTDSDWIVRLIDIYPENYAPDPSLGGYQLMIAGDVFRGRFRKSFVHPEPIVPGQVAEYTIDLHGNHHCFQKGHRIMVQVQSTWFPLIDRNPQKYVPSIFEAKDSDFQIARQKVYRSPRQASHISLPVLHSSG